MKQLLSVILIFINLNICAQAPSVVKALGGTATEPANKDQDEWVNNQWNGKFFYKGTGSNVKLCVTDGTNAGTVFVADLSGNTLKFTFPAQDFIYIITNLASFTPSFTSTDYIYKSDGTAAGTSLVYTMPSIASFTIANNWTSNRDRKNFSIVGNNMYFGGYDAASGNELWVTDGTNAGTHMVKDIKPGAGSSNPYAFCKIGNEIFFSATEIGLERKLWKTDGTIGGTVQVPVAEPFFISDYEVGMLNNRMIFYANNTVDGLEPYVSDGTPGGTFMLANINPAGNSFLTAVQDAHMRFNSTHCFFVANNGTANALWRTDGTSAGTVQLTTNAQNVSSNVSSGAYTDIDENGLWMIQFDAAGSGLNNKLYRSNGTAAGTYLVAGNLSYGQNIKIYKGALWMQSRNTGSAANAEPWRSGGNAATTNKAFEIAPGNSGSPTFTPFSSNPFGYFEKNNKLYFFASSNVNPDLNLYEYNGGFTFTPVTPARLWSDSTNWSGRMPPGITDTVVVNATGIDYPVVTGSNAYAGTLINSGSIQVINTLDSLIINKSMVSPGIAGSPVIFGNGVLAFRSNTNDTVVINGKFSPSRMAVMNHTIMRSPVGSSDNRVEFYDNLNLVNDSRIVLDNMWIVLMTTLGNITRSANSYIITGSNSVLIIHNIGPGGRTGPVLFPVGSADHYNPVTLTNTGVRSSFEVQSIPGIHNNYAGNFGYNTITTNAVNNTWMVNGPFSGTDVTMTVQWDEAQELPGFNRSAPFLGHYLYNSSAWDYGPAVTATGSNPYTLTRSGITSFSPFGVLNASGSLPLDFLSFSAAPCGNGEVCLRWETANEQDVSHFEIQRSADGRNFTSIHSIPAKNQPLNLYTHTDNLSSLQGRNTWYRIRQADRDGKTSYSAIRYVTTDRDRLVTFYPNPFTGVLNISNWQEVREMQLYDIGGKKIREWNTVPPSLDLEELDKGVYLVRIWLKDGVSFAYKVVRR